MLAITNAATAELHCCTDKNKGLLSYYTKTSSLMLQHSFKGKQSHAT